MCSSGRVPSLRRPAPGGDHSRCRDARSRGAKRPAQIARGAAARDDVRPDDGRAECAAAYCALALHAAGLRPAHRTGGRRGADARPRDGRDATRGPRRHLPTVAWARRWRSVRPTWPCCAKRRCCCCVRRRRTTAVASRLQAAAVLTTGPSRKDRSREDVALLLRMLASMLRDHRAAQSAAPTSRASRTP